MIHLIEQIQSAILLKPQLDGALTSDYLSLKNAKGKAWIKVVMAQAEATRCTITLGQATKVDGTDAKALSNNAEIWSNEDLSTSDMLTKQTSAKIFQFDAELKNKVVWFQLDLAECFDVANNFDVVYLTSGGSNVANILMAELFIEPKSTNFKSLIVD